MVTKYKHKHTIDKIRHKKIECLVEIRDAKVGPSSISTITQINAALQSFYNILIFCRQI